MTVGAKGARAELQARLHRALADPSRVRILEALRAGEPLDAHELAERVQLHPNTVRAHLHVLVEAGLARARREERTKPGRPRIVYEAAPEPERPTPAEPYRLLAKILAGCLDASGDDPVVRAEEAGRAWGRYLVGRPAPFTSVSSENALGELVRLLDEYGFEPSLESSEQERLLWMHACPFREVAASHQTVVDRKSTRLNSSHIQKSRMPSSA